MPFRILWVDDNIEELRSHVVYLGEKGYAVDGAANGIDALAMLRDKRYDAVQFAIDARQRIREVGMLGRLASGGVQADLSLLAKEPTYYNWERDLDARLAADNATVVQVASDLRR